MGLSVTNSNAGGPDDTGEDGSEEGWTGEVVGEPIIEDIFVTEEEVWWER